MKATVVVGVLVSVGVLAALLSVPHAHAQVKPEEAAKVRAAAEQYVKQEQQQKGGFFLRGQDKVLRDLQFGYVHSGVEKPSANQFAVCVDFLDQNKKRLDVDFYFSPNTSGGYDVKQIKVHKIDGVEQKEK
ncbi:MAG: hypothetical protein HYX73_00195 [Acidobacteria bacterium]|nr:hypothetical protein [Acidobacteriota bacterium]